MSRAICKITDVPVNEIKQFETADGEKICIVNGGDRFFACQALKLPPLCVDHIDDAHGRERTDTMRHPDRR